MKQFKFFAVALAALTMFSCSKENITDNSGGSAPGEKATLTINVVGQANLKPGTKTAGAVVSTDVTVNNYIVFLFRADGSLDCPAQYNSDGNALTITAGTTAAKKAYVVTNTGAIAGDLATVKTEAQLKLAVGNLMSAPNTSSQTGINAWMASDGAAITFGSGDNTNVGTAKAVLKFVSSKIELRVKDGRENNDPVANTANGSISIKDNSVVLLFAGAHGKFFGTAAEQATQNTFYTGDITYLDPFDTNVTESTALSDAIGTPFNKTALTAVNHFYTFANNGATKPTILAIKSTKTVVGGASTTIYYPIHFITTDAGSTIEPGMHYTVDVTLKGNVNNGGGGGTIEPEEPMSQADITISITPAIWQTKTIIKDFN